jgi:hypothetical protein
MIDAVETEILVLTIGIFAMYTLFVLAYAWNERKKRFIKYMGYEKEYYTFCKLDKELEK